MGQNQPNDKSGEGNSPKNKDGDSKAVENVKEILKEAGVDDEVVEETTNRVRTLEKQRGKKAEKLSKYEELGNVEEIKEQLNKDEDNEPKGKKTGEADDDEIDSKIEKKLQERDLKQLPYPDEVKEEIRDWADYKGISIQEAAQADHIQPKIEEWSKENDVQNASISRTGTKPTSKSTQETPDFDMTTEEGRKKWEEHKKKMKKKG